MMRITAWASNVCTCSECCKLQPDRLRLREENARELRDGAHGKPYLSAETLGDMPKKDMRKRRQGAQALRLGRRGRTD